MRSIAIVMAVLIGAPTIASADIWRCSYVGHWRTRSTGDTGDFAWLLTWRAVDDGWEVTGKYTDKYGESTLSGTCTHRMCNLDQHYVSGALDGKSYYWRGSYSETADSPDRTMNRFNGTWGDSVDDRANGGPWTATAACQRESRH